MQMKTMGRLKLQMDVKNLECSGSYKFELYLSGSVFRVCVLFVFVFSQILTPPVPLVSANQYDSLSPFLVPVTSTVCLHLRTVKLLVATQRSVIIIPKQVYFLFSFEEETCTYNSRYAGNYPPN